VHIFVALGIQHAVCMCHTVICDLSDSTICFHINFQMKQFSETFLILRGIQQHTIINLHTSSSEVPIIHVRFQLEL